MAYYYADSSVLVKRHVYEAGTKWVQSLVLPENRHVILTSRISMVEVFSALNRRLREANLSYTDYNQIAGDFEALCETEYQLFELTQVVINRARQLLEIHPLRAYDAIQLATGLLGNEIFQEVGLASLTFLTADTRLLNAAETEGLKVDSPLNYG